MLKRSVLAKKYTLSVSCGWEMCTGERRTPISAAAITSCWAEIRARSVRAPGVISIFNWWYLSTFDAACSESGAKGGGEGGKGIVQITGDSASPPLRKRSREEEKWPSCSGRFYRLSALCAAEREHCAYRHGPKSNTFMRGWLKSLFEVTEGAMRAGRSRAWRGERRPLRKVPC